MDGIVLERTTVIFYTNQFEVQKLLEGDANKTSKQRVGFKSAMISDLKLLTDGRVQH